MISPRVTESNFIEAIKDLSWSTNFINFVKLEDNLLYRIDVSIEDTCLCGQKIKEGEIVLFKYFDVYHLSCFKEVICEICLDKWIVSKVPEINLIGDQVVCNRCVSSMVPCASCEKQYFKNDLINGYCRFCTRNCSRCSTSTPLPQILRIREADLCNNCAKRDVWVRNHDFNPLQLLKFQGNPKNGLYFGVELEIEAGSTKICADMAEDLTKTLGKSLIVKHDGSLDARGQNGLEIVTAPGDLGFHRDLWAKFFDRGFKFKSSESNRCSTHIHLSKAGLKEIQIARMASFMYSKNLRRIIVLIAERELENDWGDRYTSIKHKVNITDVVSVFGSRSYCRRTYQTRDEKILDSLTMPPDMRRVTMLPSRQNRYSALNLTNPNTIEFRIFRGTSNYSTMMKNLEFCQSLVDYCGTAVVSREKLLSEESYIAFVKDSSSFYPHLVKFLQAKSWLPSKTVKKECKV